MSKASIAFQQSFNRWLPYQCSLVTSFVSRRMFDYYNREFGISVTDWRMLAVLNANQPSSAGALARRSGMDAVQTTRAIASLLKQKLVRRESDRRDRRRAVLTLTRAGLRVVEKVAPMALALEADLLAKLTASEQAALKRAMFKLETAIDRIWLADERTAPAGVALPSETAVTAAKRRRPEAAASRRPNA
ncbi:MAG: MarR family winged helix-turn-helix transcriptional regulator [Alphaproteobacteria bacterium]